MLTRKRIIICSVLIIVFITSLLSLKKETTDSLYEVEVVHREEKKELEREIVVLEKKLSRGTFFQGGDEWQAHEIPYYDIDLSYDLQMYTFARCVDLGIEKYYEIILALMWQESNFKTNVISSTNDYGLMQINKVNHKWLSKELGITDFLDPYQNIDAGTYIIGSLLLKYDDPHKALMAYNFGEAAARRHWERGTYSSSYSRDIEDKQTYILSN